MMSGIFSSGCHLVILMGPLYTDYRVHTHLPSSLSLKMKNKLVQWSTGQIIPLSLGSSIFLGICSGDGMVFIPGALPSG